VTKLRDKKKELEDEYSLKLTARSSNRIESSFNGLTHSVTIKSPLQRMASIELTQSIPMGSSKNGEEDSKKIAIL
jgi:hypothetical protein